MSIEDLRGVGHQTRDKLRAAGVTTLEILAILGVRDLAAMTGLEEKKALDLIQQARRRLGEEFEIQTATQMLEKRKTVIRITTGSKALDAILGGGIETQAITEFAGAFGAGKSQLCHQLAVNVHLPQERGGTMKPNGQPPSTIYIDTESTFRPERLKQMAEALKLDPQQVLDHTYISEAYSSDYLAWLVDRCFTFAPQKNAKLIIVDSIIGQYRPEYQGREALAERQQKLNRTLHRLLKLAQAYNLSVVVTNQVISQPGVYHGNPDKPAGGHILAHNCVYRLWLTRHSEGHRTARLFDSPYQPEAKAEFRITGRGVEDL